MMRQWRSEYIEKKIRMRRKVHEVAVEEVIEKCYSVGAERETTVKVNSGEACDKNITMKALECSSVYNSRKE